MNAIEKNKSRFIVNFGDGKQTYFDFANGVIYGASGRPVKSFCPEAKKILKENKENDFLARFLYEKMNATVSNYAGLFSWKLGMVETIYSLYHDEYPVDILLAVAEFCYTRNFTLDSQNVKLLTEALSFFKGDNIRPCFVQSRDIEKSIWRIKYGDFPAIYNILPILSQTTRNIIIEDIEKIAFRMKHEAWELFNNGPTILAGHLIDYINLCDLLHKERTYKNLYLSICQMRKEQELMNEKLCANWQFKNKLFYENEDFTIIVPTTADEFRFEAEVQHNCVFRSYFQEVVDHQTHIVFVRKKEEPKKPYITCEVSIDGKIVQYLAQFNDQPKDELALKFAKEYSEFLKKQF